MPINVVTITVFDINEALPECDLLKYGCGRWWRNVPQGLMCSVWGSLTTTFIFSVLANLYKQF